MTGPSDHKPPEWVSKLLSLFLNSRLLEASLGDLEEKFQIKLRANTPYWKAKLLYTIEGVGFLRMGSLQKYSSPQTTMTMIRHTVLFLSRLIRKDLSYYFVSLLGLALSLASFMCIMMFIADELSYDKFHENGDRIYRVTTHLQLNDVTYHEATSQFPAAKALQSEFPEVEEAVRLYPEDLTFESGDKKFQEHVLFADENFPKVFSFDLVLGDPRTAFNNPSNVMLTETTAKKYFGSVNPLGKIIQSRGQSLIVSAVLKDIPEQSHIKFDAIIPMTLILNYWKSETGLEGRENKWYWTGAYTYILLKEGVVQTTVISKLPLIIEKYFPPRYKETGTFDLQPLTENHLRSNLDAELEPGGNILYVRLFSIVAVVIMIVSAINLINLSYFKISSRIRELGIRKFLGQNSARIITQLSIESVLIGVTGFLLAVVFCHLSLSSFNLLVQKDMKLWSLPNSLLTAATFALIIVICLASVLRPAIRYATRPSGDLLLHNITEEEPKSGIP
jgi:putative ABC transport system permease protein